MARTAWVGGLLVLAGWMGAQGAMAQAIPSSLKEWQGWVLDGESARACTLLAGRTGQALSDFSCVAASTLDLSSHGEGISFQVRVRADEESLVDLPGETGRWPKHVLLDGQPATLRWNAERWQVVIPPGEHTVSGQWADGFEQIAMPALFAQARWLPEQRALRHENGRTWVRTRPATPEAVEQAPAAPQVRVWRALQDGQVLTLETRVDLRLSGSVARLDLGAVLPGGFHATGWTGTVPVVVTPQGHLLVQAGRGQHQLTIQARCDEACLPKGETLPALAPGKATAPWPAQETWSVLDAHAFRRLGVEGVGVDPAQAQVPEEWRQASAYTVSADTPLRLRVVARGRVAGEGERLDLVRESWWQDNGWLHWDHLTGQLPVGGRLSMDPPFVLGRMEQHGQLLPLSVDGDQRVGVEWSQGAVDVWAQSTHPFGRTERTGWNGIVESMTQTVYLPPGATLLAAPGAQPGHGGWTDRFALLTFFGIALLALLVRQALGVRAAAVAGALAAGWVGQGGALGVLWLLAIGAALLLVGQALPTGKLVRGVRALAMASMVLLVLVFIPFAGNQARQVLHPQLADISPGRTGNFLFENNEQAASAEDTSSFAGSADMMVEKSAMPMPAPMAPPALAQRAQTAVMAANMANAVDGNDPLAGIGLAQVGQPVSTWQRLGLGRAYYLRYPGPISHDEGSVHAPIVMGSWGVRFFRALGTLGLAWLALKLLGQIVPTTWRARMPAGTQRWAAKLGLALLVVPVFAMASAHAPSIDPISGQPMEVQGRAGAEPSMSAPSLAPRVAPDVLDRLRERLTRPPVCAPYCASLVDAQLEARADMLVVTYRVDARHTSGWTLPAVVGAELVDLSTEGNTGWWLEPGVVRLTPGQSRVVARYRPSAERVRVDFAQAPLSTRATLTGWTQEGPQESGSWTLVRDDQDSQREVSQDSLPAAAEVKGYVSVVRHLHFGGTAEATTEVRRIDGNEGALTLLVPAMTGEAAEGERIERKGQDWEVVLPAGQSQVRWTSRITLPKDGGIMLTPLAGSAGTETWQFSKSPAWTLSLLGIPEGMPQGGGVRTVLPLAGETLTVMAARLPAAPGESQRIDQVVLSTQAGPKLATHTLSMTVFAAQAGERKITVPAGSQVMSIMANGRTLSLPMTGNDVLVPVERGSTRLDLQFRGETGQAWLSTPKVDLHGQAHNVRMSVNHEQGRWVLATFGPGWGTAVLYWSQLLVLLAVAVGLARLPGRLFTLPTAVLLVLGFSTLPGTVIWLGALVAWVAWVGWRARQEPALIERHRFNVCQLALAGFTGVTLLAVVVVIGYGLLGARPDMMLRAPAGLAVMEWWRDMAPEGPLAGPTVVSAPLWVYQVLLFAWALWFAGWLVASVKRALAAWTSGGYWRSKAEVIIPPVPEAPSHDG